MSHACATVCMKLPIVEVQAPIHIIRKSGYVNALNARPKTLVRRLGEWVCALDEMEDVAIAVSEENEPVALIDIRIGQEPDSTLAQLRVSGIEIRDGDGEMPNAGSFH